MNQKSNTFVSTVQTDSRIKMKPSVIKIPSICADTRGHAQRWQAFTPPFTHHQRGQSRPIYVGIAVRSFQILPIGMPDQNI